MIIFIDIDETICSHNSPPDKPRDYTKAIPNIDNISKSNKLYDSGHTIVYWTARGALTKIDWRDVTEKQLKNWGVKYHELRLDKPFYDKFIDDKAINVEDWDEKIIV